jgi:hypothetical protein
MIDRGVTDTLNADTARSPQVLWRRIVLTPSRRNVLQSIGALSAAALPTWMAGARPTQYLMLVDGWILTNTDLR